MTEINSRTPLEALRTRYATRINDAAGEEEVQAILADMNQAANFAIDGVPEEETAVNRFRSDAEVNEFFSKTGKMAVVFALLGIDQVEPPKLNLSGDNK